MTVDFDSTKISTNLKYIENITYFYVVRILIIFESSVPPDSPNTII